MTGPERGSTRVPPTTKDIALRTLVVAVVAGGLVFVLAWIGIRSLTEPTAVPSPFTTPSETLKPDGETILAAGDIANCSRAEVVTGAIMANEPGTVLPLGDLAYESGTPEEFEDCYDASWGAVYDRSRPALGNHEIGDDRAAEGYFDYFGDGVGERGKGWYSFDVGSWHLIALNSNCPGENNCDRDSEQGRWLAADLAANPDRNILAYWHEPTFSSGFHGDENSVLPLWKQLADAGAKIVLNAHDHDYERFAPMAADGSADPAGVREFVVGTGGRTLRPIEGTSRGVSEFRNDDSFGVLKLQLEACSYSWEWLAVPADQIRAETQSEPGTPSGSETVETAVLDEGSTSVC